VTRLELKLDLPDQLAREADAAGLPTPQALRRLLKDAVRRRAAQDVLAGARRASQAGSMPLSMRQIQAEVDAVRRERRGKSPHNT
jgi:negative regulator of replication initiation